MSWPQRIRAGREHASFGRGPGFLLSLLLGSSLLLLGGEARALDRNGRPRQESNQQRLNQGQELPLEVRVPHMDSGRAQLAHARRLKMRSFRGKGPEDRLFWRSLAIEAYQAVRAYHPDEPDVSAEGAFRAGELLRADKDLDAARAEFKLARKLGVGTPFRARARLELGHLARRLGDLRQALDHYLALASDSGAAVRHRENGWLWAGRCWWQRGAHVEARRAWNGVAERALDPFLALRAHDELTLAWIEEGELKEAAAQLERCGFGLTSVLLEESERGEKLSDAFRRMRARDALRSALARTQTTGSDQESIQAP
ncbi:MAG: tetratricopeptide (TPR) repeat protein [Planctomycetota bacterium]|jgi:tetratricopeptide (TPR) repeat protein